MVELAIIGIYVIGYIMTWRRVAYILAWEFGRPDSDDYAMAALMAFFVALFWPVVAPGYLIYKKEWDGRPMLDKIFKAPRSVRMKQKQRELEERENRIERMERELKIK